MKSLLPTLWFTAAGLIVLTASVAPFMFDVPLDASVALLGGTLMQAVLAGMTALAFGLTYLLISRTRPSVAAAVFGFLHLGAAILAHGARTAGDVLRHRLVAGVDELGSGTELFAAIYAVSGVGSFFSLVFFIIAVAVALSTRPPAEEAF